MTTDNSQSMNASEIKRERESEGKAPSFNAQEAIG